MKITDAYWEKRNIGVETAEIAIDREDDVAACRKRLKEVTAPYQVVKMPAGMIPMQKMMQEEGFVFMETLVRLRHDLKSCVLTPLQKRLAKDVTYVRMDACGLDVMYAQIDQGMFTTDRITLDGQFDGEQARARYKGWIGDELQRKGEAYQFICRDEAIGFCVHRVEEEASYGILGGIYPKYRSAGLGFLSLFLSIQIEQKRRARCLIADVSTNNMASLRSEIAMGFQIIDLKYVFIKHLQTGWSGGI